MIFDKNYKKNCSQLKSFYRLTGLALFHIHYNMEIDLREWERTSKKFLDFLSKNYCDKNAAAPPSLADCCLSPD